MVGETTDGKAAIVQQSAHPADVKLEMDPHHTQHKEKEDDDEYRIEMKKWFKDNLNVYTYFMVVGATYAWPPLQRKNSTQPPSTFLGLPTSKSFREFYRASAWYLWTLLFSCVLVLGVGFMQIILPVALLLEWINEGLDFVSLFGMRDDPDTEGTDVSQPVWLRMSKASVATYVLFMIAFRDVTFVYKMLLYTRRITVFLKTHADKTQVLLGVLLNVCMVFICVMYAVITMLVYLVTLMLICQVRTISDVILSGVGALFILDFDEVAAMLLKKDFGVKYEKILKTIFVDHISQEESNVHEWQGISLDHATQFIFFGLILSVYLLCPAFYVYFLHRLQTA